MLGFSHKELEDLRAKAGPIATKQARIAAERAMPVFETFQMGWAAFIAPTAERIEWSYLGFYLRVAGMKRPASISSGCLKVTIDSDGAVDFLLELSYLVLNDDGTVYDEGEILEATK